MTDIPILDPPIDPVREAQRLNRIENLVKARAAKGKNAPQRTAATRTAEHRTAADAVHAGIAANPGPARRAEAARETHAEDIITRVRRDQRDSGWADLPHHRRKPGWDYEWKTIRVYNEPVDPGDMMEVRNAGWRPETAANWPELVEPGSSPDVPIERRGQRLYGRPQRLTDEARQEDLTTAYQQQRDKTQQARTGQSAVRGEDGIPNNRAVRPVPMEVTIEGLAG